MQPVEIDGRAGEGGGQVLRTSLALAVALGVPVRIANVRAGRPKPGLLRQHLTGVRAAAEISGGDVRGAELHSTTVELWPGPVRGGHYRFAVGSAGSAALVLQTVLVPLLLADEASTLEIEGGTHNSMAPTFDFLEHSFLPQLRALGASVELELRRPGFYPAGGGCIAARIEPCRTPKPLALHDRGAPGRGRAQIHLAHLPPSIAEREWRAVQRVLHWPSDRCQIVEHTDSAGPGNTVSLLLPFEHTTAVFTGFGERRRASESVGNSVARATARFQAHTAPVCEHLADQLLLPMALLAGGSFTTVEPTLHTRTNIDTIHHFLPGVIESPPADADSAVFTVRGRQRG